MGLNRAFGRQLFVQGGTNNVKTSGGANNLATGQLAVVDMNSSGVDGATILSSFLGLPKDKKNLALQVGTPNLPATRSFANKNESTKPFSLSEIRDLRVSAPKRTEMIMDEFILGYNGIDENTAFSFKTGQAYLSISLQIKNGALQYRGGATDFEQILVNVEIPSCDPYENCEDCDTCDPVDCQAITMEAIKRLKNHQLAGGKPVSEFVEITPVFGNCRYDATATLVPYNYWTLSVCDTGDASALALVQAQYNVPVIRIARNGSYSTYQMLLADTASDPADYSQGIASILKGCATCPEDYTEVPGGYLYAITIEDDGADRSSVITAELANAKYVANTIVRASGNNAGVGFYTAIYSSPITRPEINTFVGTATNSRITATVDMVGLASTFCENTDTTETAWVEVSTCNAVQETYTLTLPDTVCGETRLAELQGAYADLTIAVKNTVNSTRTLTLTGTSGTANINIGGTDYLATYGSSLTATAAAFVTSHAATILTDEGVTVTSAGAVLTFVGLTATTAAITITNATTNLAGTLGTNTAIPDRQGCSTRYTTTVISNLVCEECDPIFLDYYVTKAPESFGTHQWVADDNSTSNPHTNCLCGIRFKGKSFVLSADEALRDMIRFEESGTEIQVAGGFSEEIREAIGYLPKGTIPVYEVSRYTPRTHLYGNVRDLEQEGRAYFKGTNYQDKLLARTLLLETNKIQDNLSQYVVYYLEIAHNKYSNGFATTHVDNISYEIYVPLGEHTAVQTLLNNLAANAGKSAVSA